MFALLFLSLIAQAGLREPGEMPGPRRICRQADMNACIQDHTNGKNFQLRAIAEIDDKLRLLAVDQGTITRSVQAMQSEARSARVTGEMADLELSFSENLLRSVPVFPDGPSPEEIFFLRGEENSWGELHAENRRARLIALSSSSREKIAELAPLQRNLTIEIEALGAANTSLQLERTQRGQQVNIHAGMCSEGCKMQFCGDY